MSAAELHSRDTQARDTLTIDLTSIHRATATYYEAALAKYGATARGVDWKDAASHRLRHLQFMRLITDNANASILDLGCGYGAFLTLLRGHGHKGAYLGCDVASGMIAAARGLHGEGPDRSWHVGAKPPYAMDYAIASGILNVRRGADPAGWAPYVDEVIDTLAKFSRGGFGFNVLTSCSDPEKRRGDLYYADPVATLASCLARFGRNVALLQDYGLWEFTVLVRHSSQTASPNPVRP